MPNKIALVYINSFLEMCKPKLTSQDLFLILRNELSADYLIQDVIIPDRIKDDPYEIRNSIASEATGCAGIIILGNLPTFKILLNGSNNGTSDNLYGDFDGRFQRVRDIRNEWVHPVTGEVYPDVTTNDNKLPKDFTLDKWVCRIDPFMRNSEDPYTELKEYLIRITNSYQWHDFSVVYLRRLYDMEPMAHNVYKYLLEANERHLKYMTEVHEYDDQGGLGCGHFRVHQNDLVGKCFWDEIVRRPKILGYMAHSWQENLGELNRDEFYDDVTTQLTKIMPDCGAEFMKLDACNVASLYRIARDGSSWVKIDDPIAQLILFNTATKAIVGNGISGKDSFVGYDACWLDDLRKNQFHVGKTILSRINNHAGTAFQIYSITLAHYGWPHLREYHTKPPRVREVVASGSISIKDDEVGSDVYGRLDFKNAGVVSPIQPSRKLVNTSKCVGGEVVFKLELDAIYQDNNDVKISGKAILYEGINCNTTDEDDSQDVDLVVPKDGNYTLHINLENRGVFVGGDYARGTVQFENTAKSTQ